MIVKTLRAVAAIDLGGVGAGAAFDQVAVVARIPDHAVVAGFAEHLVVAVAAGQHVVAGAAEQEVVAALAEQRVVAGLAEQQVVARAAGDDVVAGAAEQVGRGQRAVGFVERDDVVAALAEHLDQAGVGDGRRAAQDRYGAAVDENLAGGVAAERQGYWQIASPNTVSTPLPGEKTAGYSHCRVPSMQGERPSRAHAWICCQRSS